MRYSRKILLLLIVSVIFSCQNDDAPGIYEEGTNAYTNDWIYKQMKRYYYWNKDLSGPGDLSMAPRDYFAGLLDEEDRFSYGYHPAQAETFPRSVRGLYGFDISFVEHGGQVYGVVLYVLSGSPAYNNGLQRGQYIRAINGVLLTHQNYESLYSDLLQANQADLQVINYNPESGFSVPQQVSIPEGPTFLQPVSSYIIEEGSDKVGYIEIPHFDIGLAQSLLQVFLEFKSRSVNKIIVDLRYNGGGDISSAAALSIILAPNIQAGDRFITFKGNQNGGIVIQSFKQTLEMNEFAVGFEALRAAHPPIQEVYVLCGNRTASASEIIINNLKPFMEVITIGGKTIGKDVAGFAIEDKRIAGQQGWVLNPAIYKLYNSLDEGDYSGGIIPAIETNELQEIKIFPLGNPNEVLLQRALNRISGNERLPYSGRVKTLPMQQEPDADFLQIDPLL